jgi:MFS family permease
MSSEREGNDIKAAAAVSIGSEDVSSDKAQPHPRNKAVKGLRSIQRYIWDDPDKPKKEKWFLFKLDVFLLSAACLGYFSKNLDQANINNAYVSGMKEALHMSGSELTYAGNCFTAGYVIGQLPAVILATRVRPSILIPTAEILWSVCTFCTAAVHTTSQLYALRFLVALCEGAYFPVMIYMIGSWYTKHERGKRMTLFYATASLAQMFSGYLQAGAYKGLGGRGGLEGWQWLYIVCGIISLPIGFLGYFFYPDFPETTRAFYITKDEALLAGQRLVRDGMTPLGASAWDKTKIFRIARQWQFWLLPLGYFFVQSGFPVYQPVYALWLKATGHSVYQVNVWPTGQIAVGVVVQVLAGMLSDSPFLRGRRWQAIVFMQSFTIFSSVVLAVWDVPSGLKYTAYYVLWSCAGVPGIYYAWYSDLIKHDHEMRGFVIAASNMFSYIQSIWFTIAVWKTVEAPRFHKGFIAASVLGCALVVFTVGVRFLEVRTDRRTQQRRGDIHQGEAGDVEANGGASKADADASVEAGHVVVSK